MTASAGTLSLWAVLSDDDSEAAAIFEQIEKRDAEALAELNVGLRMLSILLTLSGSAMALFFLSPEEGLSSDPALMADPLLRFHHAYVSHFPTVAVLLLVANIVLISGLVYIQMRSGWPRDIVQQFGFGEPPPARPMSAWRSLFLEKLAEASLATRRMERLIFFGGALIVVIIPVQLAVIAALVTIFRKALT